MGRLHVQLLAVRCVQFTTKLISLRLKSQNLNSMSVM